MEAATPTRPSGWLFPARTTAYFLAGAAVCLGLMALLGLQQIKTANQENSGVRIDRAGRAAAALFEERVDAVDVVRGPQGSPQAIVLSGDASLAPGQSWDELLDSIAGVNQGAGNLFLLNPDTASFDRFSTTFRTPDGDRVGAGGVAPGLIAEGHPAYESLFNGERYVGEVPVAGRLRLAYLTPIVADGGVAGILAVDVGWVDDLNRINNVASRRAATAALLLLGVLAVVCVLVMFVSFRPLQRLTDFAYSLGSSNAEPSLTLTARRDEIGYLASGLVKVAELQNSLHHRAYSDALTGIANRAALIEELDRRFEAIADADDALGFALLIVDLDGFKEINDGLGHQAGDQVLEEFADLLRAAVAPGEFVARHGGDEFALLSTIEPVGTLDVTEISRRVHDAARRVNEVPGGAGLTTSVGIAITPEHGETSVEVISHADLALYEAKNTARGASKVYDTSLSGIFQRRLYLTKELRQALDEQALHVAYQPLYDSSGRLNSVEALARWNHPTEGPISPVEFVPIAENNGLVQQLGEYILDESCRQAAAWSKAHSDVPTVCVNVSTSQIGDLQFPETVRATLRRHGLAPDRLCLELTESVLVPSKNGHHRTVLHSLAEMGVSLAIDDFGTGYSSLNYLHELVVDQVKIDRTFVNAAVKDPKQAQLLAGIIMLSKNLGLVVVLEGIETQAELSLAQANDCDLLQGFLLGKPMLADDVAARFGHSHEHLDASALEAAADRHQTEPALH